PRSTVCQYVTRGQMDLLTLRLRPGFALFPYTTLFRSNFGVRTRSLAEAPTAENLKGADIYIIVDPDTKDESENPHFVSGSTMMRSEEHTSELQSLRQLVCRLLLEKKKELEVLPNQIGR